jgi:hypothetical protein
MTTSKSPALRLNGPVDLLSAIPYLLGFHPHESLVIVGIDGSRLVVTVRLDLADACEQTLVHALTAIVRGGSTSTTAVVFTEQTKVPDQVERCFSGAAGQVGLTVSDVLLVTGGRWRSLRCSDPACCPLLGRELPEPSTAVHAAAVHAGLTALPSRETLAAVFTPAAQRRDLVDLLEHHQERYDRTRAGDTLRAHQASAVHAISDAHWVAEIGEMPSDDEAAGFAVALRLDAVRDAVWLAIDAGTLEGIQLWVNLARRLPRPYDAAPLFLAAWSSYRHGNGALAAIAADLSVAADPGYQAAELLRAILVCGISPRTLPKLGPHAPSAGDA